MIEIHYKVIPGKGLLIGDGYYPQLFIPTTPQKEVKLKDLQKLIKIINNYNKKVPESQKMS